MSRMRYGASKCSICESAAHLSPERAEDPLRSFTVNHFRYKLWRHRDEVHLNQKWGEKQNENETSNKRCNTAVVGVVAASVPKEGGTAPVVLPALRKVKKP